MFTYDYVHTVYIYIHAVRAVHMLYSQFPPNLKSEDREAIEAHSSNVRTVIWYGRMAATVTHDQEKIIHCYPFYPSLV
jgi:hypothetical protein